MKSSVLSAITLLLATGCFVPIPQAAAETDRDPNTEAVLTSYGKVLSSANISPIQANFPLEAKRRILNAIGKEGRAVIAGFFYRDLDKNSRYDLGEELGATLLGGPKLDAQGISEHRYFNCYWFDAVMPGRPYRLSYEHDGVEPVRAEIQPKAGLNIFHVRITPTKPLVYVIPHSHYDTEWVLTHEQYLKIEIPQVQQRLDLLQVDPAHGFYNDDEAVIRPFVERAGRKYVDMLRQGIVDGMVEPKGSIVQNELTMPYGESLIRNMTNGERILSDALGLRIRPEVFASIDQYGYGSQIPQIIKKAGRDYFLVGEYLGRDEESHRIPHSNPDVRKRSEFWLQGLDGSKVLAYRDPYYHFPKYPPATADLAFGPRYTPVLSHNSALNFQGADNVAPIKELTTYLDTLNAANGLFKYIISPTTSLFRAVEKSPGIPTYTSESFINHWSGVYESRVQGRIRSRRIENKILAAESLATIAGLKGMSYPQSILDEAWYLLLLNQHHDPIMSPMANPGLYEGSVLPRHDNAEAQTDAALAGTLNWLATEITANQQPGIPVIVFNPLASRRSMVVQARVPAKLSSVRVNDLHGKRVRSQVLSKSAMETSIAFLADDLPALGWRTYYVSNTPGADPQSSAGVTATENLIENEHLRIELKSGLIQRIIEKGSGTAVFQADTSAGVNEVLIWRDEGCISIVKPIDKNEVAAFVHNPKAELVGRSSGAANRKVTVLETGPARGALQIEYNLDWGVFVQKISVDAGARVIRFATDVRWDSADKISALNGRRVRVAFNSTYKNAKVFADIPFGVIEWKQSEIIRPVNSWLGIESGTNGAAFCHRGPQSIQVVDDTVYMTLFRSVVETALTKQNAVKPVNTVGNPTVVEPPRERSKCGWDNPADKAAEDGEHTINYSVYIHPGDWKTANVPNAAAGENAPVFVRVPYGNKGMLAGEDSLVSVKPTALVVTAVKPTEYSKSGTIVRLYNPTNVPISGTLATGFPQGGAEVVNFREERIRILAGEGSEFALTVAPYEIMTVRILPGKKDVAKKTP